MTAGQQVQRDRLNWNLLRSSLVIAQENTVSRAWPRLHVMSSALREAVKPRDEPSPFARMGTGDEIFRHPQGEIGQAEERWPVAAKIASYRQDWRQ